MMQGEEMGRRDGKMRLLLLAGFVLAAAVSLAFAVRFTVSLVYWSDPAHMDQTPEGWMTPRYVVRSWDVPPEVVADALSLERDGTGWRVTLDEVARASGQDLSSLVEALEGAITEHRARSGE